MIFHIFNHFLITTFKSLELLQEQNKSQGLFVHFSPGLNLLCMRSLDFGHIFFPYHFEGLISMSV